MAAVSDINIARLSLIVVPFHYVVEFKLDAIFILPLIFMPGYHNKICVLNMHPR